MGLDIIHIAWALGCCNNGSHLLRTL